jgi:hypothetical protein
VGALTGSYIPNLVSTCLDIINLTQARQDQWRLTTPVAAILPYCISISCGKQMFSKYDNAHTYGSSPGPPILALLPDADRQIARPAAPELNHVCSSISLIIHSRLRFPFDNHTIRSSFKPQVVYRNSTLRGMVLAIQCNLCDCPYSPTSLFHRSPDRFEATIRFFSKLCYHYSNSVRVITANTVLHAFRWVSCPKGSIGTKHFVSILKDIAM